MPIKNYYTPSDRDYMIRTIIGEAANEPDDGQAAVAHVILNRVNRGYGRTPTEVILAKNQFEPWSTRRGELLGYSADAPEYKRAASIVDAVISGKIKDPTSGATHFLQEDIVRGRRGGGLPDWARGQGMKIGAHTFHYPDEPDRPESQPRYASVMDKYRKGPAPAVSSDASPPLDEGLSIIDKYRKKASTPVDPLAAMTPKPPEGGRVEAPPFEPTRRGVVSDMLARSASRARLDLPIIGNKLIGVPGEFLRSAIANTVGGYDLSREGVKEMLQGNILPSGPVMQPSEWRAGGAAKTAAGVLQAVGGATGVIPATELLEEIVSNLTGSEAAGKKAGLIGNVAGSVALTNKLNAVRPTVRARTMAGDLSPEELARLQSNPRLTPMDVNPSMQGRGMGLATGEGGDAAKNLLYSRARDRVESAPQAARDIYATEFGTPPVVTEALRGYQQTAKDNARKGFGEAFKDVQFVNPQPVIAAIDARLKPGVQQVTSPGTQVAHGPFEQRLIQLRNDLTDGVSVVTDPMRLHEIQYMLGREIRNLSKSAVGSDKNLADRLHKVHSQLVKQIDDATGGKYQPARAKFKEDMEVTEAFEKGFEVFDTGKGLGGQIQDSPAAWREWVTGRDTKGKKIGEPASAEELAAARLGALSEIERRINGYRHSARRAGDIDAVPWNHEKLEILFGKKEADRLQRLLKDERDMATTDNRLIHNSKTAEAMINAKSIVPRQPGTAVNDLVLPVIAEGAASLAVGGFTGGWVGGATMAARRVANAMGKRNDLARNEILADMISLNPAANPGNRLMPGPQSPLRITVSKAARMTPVTYVPENVRAKPVPVTKD